MTETKNEEKVEEKNYINFTDSLIEKIFDSNEDIDADNFCVFTADGQELPEINTVIYQIDLYDE